jgi:hypothetical protein
MKLDAFLLHDIPIDIRPAPLERDWMEATNQRYAYRCLPLNIANGHGWEIHCPAGFTAQWSGGAANDAISIRSDSDIPLPAVSHFGHGVMTFHIGALFRTEPGYDLMVQGPVNRPKDGIYALSGVIETDWAPFTFTMNWIFTRPGHEIRFEKDEPFCHLFPVRRGELETISPKLRRLNEDPTLKTQYEAWTAGRAKFNADLKKPGSDAVKDGWQKHYYRGEDTAGEPATVDGHRTRVRLKPFRKLK